MNLSILYSRRDPGQTGLFSATVAAFILVSYQQLQPSPNDVTNQLLAQISQQLSSFPNAAPPSAPLTFPSQTPFQPTSSAVRVNALWFTSLATSTACALWATLMQQWTRRYVQVADRPYYPPKRAQIRAFFADGMEKFGLAAAIEVLPALLHASVLLFFIGLIDFLLSINHTVAFILLALVSLAVLVYFLLTIMPLYYHNTPYQTPLSSLVWFIIEAAPLIKLWLLRRTDEMQKRLDKIKKGMRLALETKANHPTARALQETLMSLDEDHELEEFLDGLPGLFHGSMALPHGMKPDLEPSVGPVADKLLATCTTGLLPEGVKRQRLTACLGAIWCFSNTSDRHLRAIWDQWTQSTNDPWGPLSTETWAVAVKIPDDSDPLTAIRAHCVEALIAAMWKNGRWQCLPSEASSLLQLQLGAPSVAIDRWDEREGHLQLAVAANLLSKVIPLLRELGTRPDILLPLKTDIKAILDMICDELVTSDVPDDLRSRFTNRSEVVKVFNIQGLPRSLRHRAAVDTYGPWTKIFTPVDIGRGN